jgi:hypothetical protein
LISRSDNSACAHLVPVRPPRFKMSQPSDRYVHEVSSGVLSSHQAEALLELKALLENLEQVNASGSFYNPLTIINPASRVPKSCPRDGETPPNDASCHRGSSGSSSRPCQCLLASFQTYLTHIQFKMSLFMYLRSRPNDLSLEDLTIMQR